MIAGNLGDDLVSELPPDLPLDDDPDLRLRIGRYLGHYRRHKKITQENAAKGIKMSRPHLSNIEQGRARTGWEGLRNMAAYYDIGIQELIADVQREMPAVPAVSKTGLPGPRAERSIAANAQHILSDDESFVIHMWRALSADRRNVIRKQLVNLVNEQSNEFSRR